MLISAKAFSPKHILNRYRLARDYLGRRIICKGLPNDITIELTNHCNLDCIMCPRSKQARKVGFMDFNLFKKIIDQVAGFAELIDLDLYGESLMHPRAIDMIRYCKSKKLNTVVSTNLTYANKKMIEDIITSGLDQITLSLDGVTKETYEFVRRGAKFEQTMQNVKMFLDTKKQLKSETPFVSIQMIYMENTKKEAEEFLKIWEKSSANVVRLKPFLNLDKQTGHLSALTFDPSNEPCLMLWRKLVVTWDGIVVPCCNDYDKIHPLGDLNVQTVRAVWNGAALRAARQIHAQGKWQSIKLCSGCRPFEASLPAMMGSVLIDDLTLKRILPIVEKMVIKGSRLLKYS